MDSYSLLIRPSAAKEIAALPRKDRERVTSRINSLASDPRPAGSQKLSGQEGVYRLRQGSCRVIYMVDDSRKTVGVIRVRHRKEAYR